MLAIVREGKCAIEANRVDVQKRRGATHLDFCSKYDERISRVGKLEYSTELVFGEFADILNLQLRRLSFVSVCLI
jgi:hypothetical protein